MWKNPQEQPTYHFYKGGFTNHVCTKGCSFYYLESANKGTYTVKKMPKNTNVICEDSLAW